MFDYESSRRNLLEFLAKGQKCFSEIEKYAGFCADDLKRELLILQQCGDIKSNYTDSAAYNSQINPVFKITEQGRARLKS